MLRITHRESSKCTIYSVLQELLPLKWLYFLPFKVKGQTKPPLHSVTGLLSPGNKNKTRKAIRCDVVSIFVNIAAKRISALVTFSSSKRSDRLRLLSLHCRRIERVGSQQLEESRAILLSEECRGLTMEGA